MGEEEYEDMNNESCVHRGVNTKQALSCGLFGVDGADQGQTMNEFMN